MAGLTPEDMDVAEIYNSLRDPGAARHRVASASPSRATGWKGAADGSTWIDGKVGVNLSGGLLCKGHPLGATGTSQAVDVIEQLRGTAPKDIQRKDAEIGISACRGGPGAVAAIHIYQRLEG